MGRKKVSILFCLFTVLIMLSSCDGFIRSGYNLDFTVNDTAIGSYDKIVLDFTSSDGSVNYVHSYDAGTKAGTLKLDKRTWKLKASAMLNDSSCVGTFESDIAIPSTGKASIEIRFEPCEVLSPHLIPRFSVSPEKIDPFESVTVTLLNGDSSCMYKLYVDGAIAGTGGSTSSYTLRGNDFGAGSHEIVMVAVDGNGREYRSEKKTFEVNESIYLGWDTRWKDGKPTLEFSSYVFLRKDNPHYGKNFTYRWYLGYGQDMKLIKTTKEDSTNILAEEWGGTPFMDMRVSVYDGEELIGSETRMGRVPVKEDERASYSVKVCADGADLPLSIDTPYIRPEVSSFIWSENGNPVGTDSPTYTRHFSEADSGKTFRIDLSIVPKDEKLKDYMFRNSFKVNVISENGKGIVIDYWTHEDPKRTALENRYIAEFCKTHPGVTVNRIEKPFVHLIDDIENSLRSGGGPTLFAVRGNEINRMAREGKIVPMDYQSAGYADADAVRNEYLPGVLEPAICNNQIYGVPLEITNWSILLNKSVFRDAGLDPEKDYPKTWEDMVAVSEKIVIRDTDGTILRRGFDFRYPYNLEGTLAMVEQFGGSLISEDGTEGIIGKDAWVNWLTFMRDWGPLGKNLGDPRLPKARREWRKFSGKIAMCMTGLYQQEYMKKDNPEIYASGDWMAVPYPRFRNAVKDSASKYYGLYFGVNANSKPEEQSTAWEFMSYMLSHATEYLTEATLIHPTKALMQSPEWKAIPYSEVYANDIARGSVVYYGDGLEDIHKALEKAVNAVMLEGVSPETAYDSLHSEVNAILLSNRK